MSNYLGMFCSVKDMWFILCEDFTCTEGMCNILFTISYKAAIINLRVACDPDIGTNKSSKAFSQGQNSN